MTRTAGLLALCALAAIMPGCVSANGGDRAARVPDLRGPDTCGAADHLDLVGQPLAVLAERGLDRGVRTIGPNQGVTMDHLPERLNVLHDDAGIITGLRCG